MRPGYRLKALDNAVNEMYMTLYNFLPTWQRHSIAVLPSIYMINVLDVDLYLYSFKLMSSWEDMKLYMVGSWGNPENYAYGSIYSLAG